jgi:undecaprenyl-diphosphatase
MDVWSSLWELDRAVFKALNLAGTNTALDVVMVLFTILGAIYVIALLSVPLWVYGKKDRAFDLIVLIVVVSLLVGLIKLAVGRERPYEVIPSVNVVSLGGFSRESDSSFPSAHAARAFAMAVILSYGVPRLRALALIGTAVMIGISRIYLGVHWPSDVLAGALVGAAAALTVIKIGKVQGVYSRCRQRTVSAIEVALSRIRKSGRMRQRDALLPNSIQ